MISGRFLGGIAAVIWDRDGRYLLLRRSSRKDYGAGEWECVTGRVDQGESYTQALHREVLEEIGCRVQIEFLIGTTHFYRGEVVPDNELLGVVFGCTLLDDCFPVHGEEHAEMLWAGIEQIETMLPADHWLLRVIHLSRKMRSGLSTDMQREIRRYGLEI